jgi:hypothetical protein
MAKYEIEVDVCLGIGHCGSVNADGKCEVELTDAEVEQLINLMRSKNTTDVEEMDLENELPEIYEKLHDAYSEIARKVEYDHWLTGGYFEGEYDELYNYYDLVKYCIDNTSFGETFEFYLEGTDIEDFVDEESDEIDLEALFEEYSNLHEKFSSWLRHYLLEELTMDERIEFIETQMNAELDCEDFDYEPEIPAKIIEMAGVE